MFQWANHFLCYKLLTGNNCLIQVWWNKSFIQNITKKCLRSLIIYYVYRHKKNKIVNK